MRTRMGLRAVLFAAVAACATSAQAQDYAPPDPIMPLPLYSTRPEDGGFYCAGQFLYYKQNHVLKDQLIAVRGYFDADGSITGQPGTFIGSGNPALKANDLGQGTFVPGFGLTLGWKFQNGVAVETNWKHVAEAKYTASASLAAPGFDSDPSLAETYLSSFVFNFPPSYAGEPINVGGTGPGSTFGIWNAATTMQIQLVQRFDQFDIKGRIPISLTECNRSYGLIGPRFAWIWERFKWTTEDANPAGLATEADIAVYSNTVSNRMYGAFLGWGNERRLGDTPIGTFAVSLDLEVALMLDYVREIAKYERLDKATQAKRTRLDYTLVPELQGELCFWWYPIEGIQIRVGYDAMLYFNTVGAPLPVSFNFGALDNEWRKGQTRYIHGLDVGIGFIF